MVFCHWPLLTHLSCLLWHNQDLSVQHHLENTKESVVHDLKAVNFYSLLLSQQLLLQLWKFGVKLDQDRAVRTDYQWLYMAYKLYVGDNNGSVRRGMVCQQCSQGLNTQPDIIHRQQKLWGFTCSLLFVLTLTLRFFHMVWMSGVKTEMHLKPLKFAPSPFCCTKLENWDSVFPTGMYWTA